MRYVVIVLALAVALIVAGCGGKQAAQQPAQQPKPQAQPAAPAPSGEGQKVEVKMSEFKFEISPAEVKAGKVAFDVENAGTVEHSFIIEQLGKGSEQIRPGQEAKFELDLKPGTYNVYCDVAGHKEAGMQAQVVVK